MSDRTDSTDNSPVQTPKRSWWWLFAVPVLAVVAAYRTSPGFDLVGDAGFLIVDNPWMQDLGTFVDQLTHDYFWAPTGEVIGYWRPVTKASWLLETVAGGGASWVYHVVQVAWFALAALGISVLARLMGLTRLLAAAAGVMFALHPAAVEPVCLVMARSDVVAAAGVIWALVFWIRWRRRGSVADLLLHGFALVIALGSKEIAVLTLPLLLCWALAEGDYRRGNRRRLATLLPAVVLTLSYLGLRAHFLGDHGSTSVTLSLQRMIAGYGMYLQGLVPFRLHTGVRNMSFVEVRSAGAILVGVGATVVVLAATLWSFARRNWAGLVLLAWIVGSLFIVLMVGKMRVPGLDGKYGHADRWLLQAAGAASLFYCFLVGKSCRPVLTKLFVGAVALWAAAAIIVAPTTHGHYENEITLLNAEDERFHSTPPEHRTETDICRFHERTIVRAVSQDDVVQAYEAWSEMSAPCRSGGDVAFNLLSVLVSHGRYEQARPLADQLLVDPITGRFGPQTLYLTGVTLLHTGNAQRARALLGEARSLGLSDCVVIVTEAQAAAAMELFADAAALFEEAYSCTEMDESSDPQLLLAAADLWRRAGRADRARDLLDRLATMALPPPAQPLFDALRRDLNPPTSEPMIDPGP